SITRHRHVNEIDWSLDVRRQAIGNINHIGHVDGLDDVLVVGVAVTEMEQQCDVGRHSFCKIGQDAGKAFQHVSAILTVGIRLIALKSCKHRRCDIELDGNLIVRQADGDLIDLALKRLVKYGIKRLVEIVLKEKPDYRMRGN